MNLAEPDRNLYHIRIVYTQSADMQETRNIKKLFNLAPGDVDILQGAVVKGIADNQSDALRHAIREYGIRNRIGRVTA